jgi:hypothetical protein
MGEFKETTGVRFGKIFKIVKIIKNRKYKYDISKIFIYDHVQVYEIFFSGKICFNKGEILKFHEDKHYYRRSKKYHFLLKHSKIIDIDNRLKMEKKFNPMKTRFLTVKM